MYEQIDGALLKSLIFSGMKALERSKDVVNNLNVFPVPDGDTGTNMCLTLLNGYNAVNQLDDESLQTVAEKFSYGVVLGARGNSGVILSQFFKGVCDGLKSVEKASAQNLLGAFSLGVRTAYGAVLEPVEGTMLTVLREATESCLSRFMSEGQFSLDELIDCFLKRAQRSLSETPDKLDVLKKAGVVDSGGAGVVYIFEGFQMAIRGEDLNYDRDKSTSSVKPVDYSLIDGDTKFVYGYCTEVLLQIKRGVVFNESDFTDTVSTFGESVVVSVLGDKVKTHVHTFKPEKVFEYCHKFGEFLAVKVENMDVQFISENGKKEPLADKIPSEQIALATVVVAPDETFGLIFTEMGANAVVLGGDTCNPSVSDFISAFKSVNAREIIVFPNSANVFLTAMQSADAFKQSSVTVVNSDSADKCYAALALVDYARSAAENAEVIDQAVKNLLTVNVFKASKSAVFDGTSIRVGEYLAVKDKTIVTKSSRLADAVIETVKKISVERDVEVLTVFVGKNVDEQTLEEIVDKLSKALPLTDVVTVRTQNPVNDFLLSFE